MRHSIGIDIGASKILAGIVREDGQVIERLRVPTPTNDGNEVVAAVIGVLEQLHTAKCLEDISLVGVGIGTAGQIDFARGLVLSGTPNIRNWQNIALRDRLGPLYGLPVWVDNDVNVHLLAEAHLGSAVGKQNVLMLALGTGVGGAALVAGRLLHGAWGGAAEFGHMTVAMQGAKCNCGARGCLEVYASGTGIARQMNERLQETDGLTRKLTSQDVFMKAQQGDTLANEIIGQMVTALGAACTSLVHSFNPEMVVFGGGVMDQGDWIVDAIRHRMQDAGIKSLVQSVSFEQARFGSDAGLVGAALQCFLYQSEE